MSSTLHRSCGTQQMSGCMSNTSDRKTESRRAVLLSQHPFPTWLWNERWVWRVRFSVWGESSADTIRFACQDRQDSKGPIQKLKLLGKSTKIALPRCDGQNIWLCCRAYLQWTNASGRVNHHGSSSEQVVKPILKPGKIRNVLVVDMRLTKDVFQDCLGSLWLW